MSPRLSFAVLISLAPLAHGESLDFYRDVFPSLKANCISCHNKTTSKGGLNMETPEAMLQGGDGGPGLVPGKGETSLVVLASRHLDDMEMPPANNKSGAVNLTEEEIKLFTQWIDQGAKSSRMAEKVIQWQNLSQNVLPIYAVAVSPDGRFALCGRGNQIEIYDLSLRTWVGRLIDPALPQPAAHRAVVQSLTFSPDGQWIASGSYREAKLWQWQGAEPRPLSNSPVLDSTELTALSAATKATVQVAVRSPKDPRVALAASDGSVRVWDPSANTMVVNTRVRYEPQQAQLHMERELSSLALDLSYHQSQITKITAQNKALEELLKKAKEAVVAMGKVLPEKEKLVPPAQQAVATAQKVVDEATTALGATQEPAKLAALKSAQDKLITASTAEKSAQAAVHSAKSNISDAQADQTRITADLKKNEGLLKEAQNQVTSLQADQKEQQAKIAEVKKQLNTTPVQRLVWDDEASLIEATFADGSKQAWSAVSGQALSSSELPQWKLAQVLGQNESEHPFADRVNAVVFSPDSKFLFTGGGELSRSGDIHGFEIPSGKLTQRWLDCHDDSIFSLAFSPDGKTLVAGSADKIARGFESHSGKPTLLLEGHTNYVNAVAYRADGRVIATAGADGVVMTWDAASGERIRKMQGWVKEVTSLSFVDQSSQILTSSGENLIRVMSESGGQVRAIANLPEFMQSVVASPGGKQFLGGGEDSVLRLWDATSGKEIAAFETKSTP